MLRPASRTAALAIDLSLWPRNMTIIIDFNARCHKCSGQTAVILSDQKRK